MTKLENGSHNESPIPFKQLCDTLIPPQVKCTRDCRNEVAGDGTGVWADVLENTVEWEARISTGIGRVQTRQWEGRNCRASNRDSTETAVLSVRELHLSCLSSSYEINGWETHSLWPPSEARGYRKFGFYSHMQRKFKSPIMFSNLVKLWLFMP